MRGFWTVTLLLLALGAWTSCGSVVFGSKKDDAKPAESTPVEAEEVAVVEDCDALMQELAENCFKITAYAEDGVSVLHVIDEGGNDLGEIDLNWAASYCECYAQLAFQTFGCSGVLGHENLDDQQYEEAYGGIRGICTQPAEAQPSEPLVDVQCAPNDVACLEWKASVAIEAAKLAKENAQTKPVDVSHCQANDALCIEAARKAAEPAAATGAPVKVMAE